MAYDLTGKVKVVLDPKTFGSGFTVREFVVTVEDGKFPQEIILQCVQEKVGLLDAVQPGQDVITSYSIHYTKLYEAVRRSGGGGRRRPGGPAHRSPA